MYARPWRTAGALLAAGVVVLGGCGSPEESAGPVDVTPTPSESASSGEPTPIGTSTPPTTTTPVAPATAAEAALADFIAAGRQADAQIADAASMINGMFTTDGVREHPAAWQAAIDADARAQQTGELIPAGLATRVRVAAEQVHFDLQHRAYALSWTADFITSGLYMLAEGHPVSSPLSPSQDLESPAELAAVARTLLGFGGQSKARFADDLSTLERLAADSDKPSTAVDPASDAAGLLAYELAWLQIGLRGCNAPPGPPGTVASQAGAWAEVTIVEQWEPNVSGDGDTVAVYLPGEGWRIYFPFC